MSCFLIVLGTELDVDEFVEKTGMTCFEKKYKGHLANDLKRKKLEYSSASITISNADFSEIKTQIKAAEEFLTKHKKNLKHITTTKEIEYANILFGADDFMENGMVKSFYFPPTLVAICAELKLTIELSVYSA